jgi:hypothetical protein
VSYAIRPSTGEVMLVAGSAFVGMRRPLVVEESVRMAEDTGVSVPIATLPPS